MQSQTGEQPYVSMAANTSCLLFFLLALLNPLHVQFEISVCLSLTLSISPNLPPLPPQVVLSSLVFLLLQSDGWLLPRNSSLSLAPSLLAASLVLYLLAGHRIIPRTLSAIGRGPSIFLASELQRERERERERERDLCLPAARCLELLCLVGSVPGQLMFLSYLWTGRQLHLSLPRLLLFILPNAFLPQFGGAPSSTILGIMGVLSFCLIMLGDYTSIKFTS